MLYDTDILIWVQKGNEGAAKLIQNDDDKTISIHTYMELLQGAKNKSQHKIIKDFISEFNFSVLPLTQNIGHRALIYVQEYTLSHHLWAADALIAATAVENNLALHSSNNKHFSCIKDLDLITFHP